jgi:glycosyltransferase involved in cell wall biosynthesis
MAVSYVMTVYNKAPFLPAVLRAVAAERQETGGQILVVNDGSTDSSPALLDAFAAANPDMTVRHQVNRGVAAATNIALAAARHDLVRLIDGDDLLVRGSTALLRRAAAETRAAFAFGCWAGYDPLSSVEERPTARQDAPVALVADPLAEMIRKQLFVPSGTLAEKELYARILPLPEQYQTSQDFSLGIRIAQAARIARCDEIVCYMPVEAAGRLSGSKARMFRDTAAITRDALGSWPVRYRAAAVRRNAGRACHYARRHLPGSALRCAALQALKLAAFLPLAPVFPACMDWIAATYDPALSDTVSFP